MSEKKSVEELEEERHESVSSEEEYTIADPVEELTEEDAQGEEVVTEEEEKVGEGIEAVPGYDESALFEELAEPSEEALEEAERSMEIGTKAEAGFLPESICGRDDRVRVRATTRIPWRWLCHLRIRTKDNRLYGCTGWLIGPHTVMTAGHCVYIHAHSGWPRYIDVIAGRDGSSKPYGTVRATSFRSVRGWVNNHNWNYDYGCIILPTNLGNRIGWFGFANYKASTLRNMLVNNAGYAGDKPTGTQWFNANRISNVTGRKLYYYIDTMGGHSGSPVWRLKRGHRYAVGIHAYGGCPNSATRIVKPVFNNMLAWKK